LGRGRARQGSGGRRPNPKAKGWATSRRRVGMRFAKMLQTTDWHTAGEPLRLITGGVPPLAGATMLERRQEMAERHDRVRRLLMREPRGHSDMYGAVLTPPVTSDAHFGILFMHNEGYSTMCGHGI